MTVKELPKSDVFKAVTLPEGEREISGVYIGDLLSWVMGRAQSDNAWITIMSNINVVAVASLCDVACVILCESVELDSEAVTAAEEKGVNILSTELSAYGAAMALRELLGE